MSRSDDHAYYELLASEEMDRGDRAPEAIIAALHYELANLYSTLAARRRVDAPKLMLIEGGKFRPTVCGQ